MKKVFVFLIISIILSIPANASQNIEKEIIGNIQGEISNFESSLPDYVKDFLPNEALDNVVIGSTDITQKDFLDYSIDYLLAHIPTILRSFTGLLAILLIVSVFNTVKQGFSSEGLRQAFSLCATLCISISVFSSISQIIDTCTDYLHILCGTMNSFAPLMSALYIMTGSISSAAVSNASMMLFLSIIENFVVYALSPTMKICLCFSVVSSISGTCDLGGISRLIKNTFTGACVFLISIFSFVMSFQSVLAHSADSLSLRTARFAIGNFIPVVGGFISDSLKTVSASLSFIKNSCGVIAIIVIVILILPVIISLLLNKLSFNLISGISKALGIEGEARACDEASTLCSFTLAIVSLCSVVFIFAITILIKSSVGIS